MSYLPYRVGYLTKDLVEKAKSELGETDETKLAAIPQLQRLIKEREDIHYSLREDELLQFLRVKKFDVQRAFQLILEMCKLTRKFPEVFTPNLPDFMKPLTQGILSLLPYRDQDGCAILHLKCANWLDKVDTPFLMVVHTTVLLTVFSVIDPVTQVCGMRIILDLDTASVAHIKYLPLKLLYFSVGQPWKVHVRLKGYHIINGGHFARYIWNIGKYCFTEKMRHRFHVHNKPEELHKYIDRAVLPKEYGGDLTEKAIGPELMADSKYEELYHRILSYGFK